MQIWGEENECTFNKTEGHECDWTEKCCTMTCKITPKSWKKFCGHGDPTCGPNYVQCDGKSMQCPVSYDIKTYNGRRCVHRERERIGSGTCKDGFCVSSVCKDAGLEDCVCSHSFSKVCKVCCRHSKKGSKCQPAERFGLKSNDSSYFHRDPGIICAQTSNYQCNK
ncbi:disintegrin domain-containing protein [Nephila pilipes]|uniref:Disintegrin domain-containing protein n=1 Tax=Nephila pilipes TaxID=299642 RepID=A0A8X6PIC2_NEPPI|nr:disintegrin domain-containing protein [Nephila pilipes]